VKDEKIKPGSERRSSQLNSGIRCEDYFNMRTWLSIFSAAVLSQESGEQGSSVQNAVISSDGADDQYDWIDTALVL